MAQTQRHRETTPSAPADDGFGQPAPLTSRALMLLRGDYRAQGLTILDFLRPITSTARSMTVPPAHDEGRLDLRSGPPHGHAAIVMIVRELARRAARKWYASMEQPQSVEDPA